MKFVDHFSKRYKFCKFCTQISKTYWKKYETYVCTSVHVDESRKKRQKNIGKSRKVHEIYENV